MGKTILLQLVNKIFNLLPLTSCYWIKSSLLKAAGIECKSSLRIVSSARIVTLNVIIGEDTYIGHQVLITGNDLYKIQIGSNVDLAPRVCILSGSHEIDMIGKHSAGSGSGGDVIIEDGVWIGANSTILPGVRIGEKSVIGAGSVVTKDIPPFCISIGNPCKPIKHWDSKSGLFEGII
jgi:acetyltransferase-like isoleucine patch superfamily enzyme